MTFILGAVCAVILIALSVMVFALITPFFMFIAGILGLVFIVYPIMIVNSVLRLFGISFHKAKHQITL